MGLAEGDERFAFAHTGDDDGVAECDGTGGVTVRQVGTFVLIPELPRPQQGAVLSRAAFDAAGDAGSEDAVGGNERSPADEEGQRGVAYQGRGEGQL